VYDGVACSDARGVIDHVILIESCAELKDTQEEQCRDGHREGELDQRLAPLVPAAQLFTRMTEAPPMVSEFGIPGNLKRTGIVSLVVTSM